MTDDKEQAQDFYDEGVAFANTLVPHLNGVMERVIIYALGVIIGDTATDGDDLVRRLQTLQTIALVRFNTKQSKGPQE